MIRKIYVKIRTRKRKGVPLFVPIPSTRANCHLVFIPQTLNNKFKLFRNTEGKKKFKLFRWLMFNFIYFSYIHKNKFDNLHVNDVCVYIYILFLGRMVNLVSTICFIFIFSLNFFFGLSP